MSQSQQRLDAVFEHVRRENSHDLSGVMGTFGEEARYDDSPWDDQRIGHDHVNQIREFSRAVDWAYYFLPEPSLTETGALGGYLATFFSPATHVSPPYVRP